MFILQKKQFDNKVKTILKFDNKLKNKYLINSQIKEFYQKINYNYSKHY